MSLSVTSVPGKRAPAESHRAIARAGPPDSDRTDRASSCMTLASTGEATGTRMTTATDYRLLFAAEG